MPSGIFEDEMPEKMSEVKRPEKITNTEKVIQNTPLDITNSIQFGAEEYYCAMKFLDKKGVPRKKYADVYSLVGRIEQYKYLESCKEESQTDGEYEKILIEFQSAVTEYCRMYYLSEKTNPFNVQDFIKPKREKALKALRNRPKKELDVEDIKKLSSYLMSINCNEKMYAIGGYIDDLAEDIADHLNKE